MAKNEDTAVETKKDGTPKRKPGGARPLLVIYKSAVNDAGEPFPEVVKVTRNPYEMIEMQQEDPSLKYVKVAEAIGR